MNSWENCHSWSVLSISVDPSRDGWGTSLFPENFNCDRLIQNKHVVVVRKPHCCLPASATENTEIPIHNFPSFAFWIFWLRFCLLLFYSCNLSDWVLYLEVGSSIISLINIVQCTSSIVEYTIILFQVLYRHELALGENFRLH